MKNLLIIILGITFFQNIGYSQVNSSSIGLNTNFMHGKAYNHLSYQMRLNNSNRLNFNLAYSGGLNFNKEYYFHTFSSSIFYQHVWNIKGGFNWYLGAGVQVLSFKNNVPTMSNSYTYLGIGPEIGIEYDFNKHNVPLVLGVNYRITKGFNKSGYKSAGISLHYTFKQK